MKWLSRAVLINCALASFFAIASSGCGSSSSGKDLLGSYTVMISSMGKSDPDLMTVSPGSGGVLLLTFAAGIVTDASGPNPDGLRANLSGSSSVTLSAQPAHIDHSTGSLSGTVTGMGTITHTSCDVMLHFTSSTVSAQDYQITGSM